MSYSINLAELQERASKRVATLANAATRLPDQGSQLATVATTAEHSQAWTDEDIARFVSRRDRLLRWGYPEDRAEELAERLTLRDREQDDRHMCAECRHGQRPRCPDGAPLPAGTLHRCPVFESCALTITL